MNQHRNRYILVTGEMRSGTTFLANLLNSQKNILLYSDMLLSLFMIGKELNIKDVHQPLTDLQKNLLISNLNAEGFAIGVDFESVRNSSSWLEFFFSSIDLLKTAEENTGNVIYTGIKKTNERDYLEAMLNNGVKTIFVVRDPRDIMLSNKNRFVTHNLFASAERLKANLQLAKKLANHKNIFILRYHELMLQKEKVKAELEVFLDIALDFDLHELKMRKETKYKDNSSFGDVSKLFDPKGVSRWKGRQDEDETIFSNWFFAEEIKWIGTEPFVNTNLDRERKLISQYKKLKQKSNIKRMLKKALGSW